MEGDTDNRTRGLLSLDEIAAGLTLEVETPAIHLVNLQSTWAAMSVELLPQIMILNCVTIA